MGDRHKDKDVEVHLDGIGGVNILVKANVHRFGESVVFALRLMPHGRTLIKR